MSSFQDQPIMACGCRAMAVDQDGNPACVIHDCFIVAETQPDLTGRRARCEGYGGKSPHSRDCIISGSDCRKGKPCSCELASDGSEGDLPFFEYRGPGSYEAAMKCKNCNFLYQAHKKKEQEFANIDYKSPLGKVCDNFEPHGPYEYDRFYCGCTMGWD